MERKGNKHSRQDSQEQDQRHERHAERLKRPRLDDCNFVDETMSPLSVAVERERVDRNILTALDEDQTSSDSTSFKYQHNSYDIMYTLSTDPPVHDRDKDHDAVENITTPAAMTLAQKSGLKPAASSSVFPSTSFISRFLTDANKKIPMVLPRREACTSPRFSDGDSKKCPQEEPGNVVICRLPNEGVVTNLEAASLAAAWCAKLGLDRGWPKNYTLVSMCTRPLSGLRWDAYLFGHPSGRKYRSPNEFLPHLEWLCSSDPMVPCICKICNGERIKDLSHIEFLNPPPDMAEQSEPESENAASIENVEKPVSVIAEAAAPIPLVLPSAPTSEPLKKSTILDADWGADNSDSSSEDGSYGGDLSNESESESDDMDDDDDDDSEDSDSNDETGEPQKVVFGDLEAVNGPSSFSSVSRRPKLLPKMGASRILPVDVLNSLYTPLRKSEIAWYPSARLNFQPAPSNLDKFLQRMPMWPVLLLSHPDPASRLAIILPLPLPSPSEIQAAASLYPENHAPPFLRSTVRTTDTPSHYTPKPTNAPIFGPRTVHVSDLVPWRQISATPPHHSRKYMSTDHAWQRRWNRGVLQAVGASSTWEPLFATEKAEKREEECEHPQSTEIDNAVSTLGTVWKEMKAVRYGAEVVRVGDWVHVVLPSPFVDDKMEMRNIAVSQAVVKHRLMRVDRLVFRSPAVNSLRRFEGGMIEGLEEMRARQILEAQRKVGKVIVEGEVYVFRKKMGWVLVGKKRCTMRKVVTGRRFGFEKGAEAALGDVALAGGYDGSKEVEEVGGGFGQLGLIVGEGRRYWNGWVDTIVGRSDSEDVDGGKVSAKVELVRTLEAIGSDGREAEASDVGVDFNYEEDNEDEAGGGGGPVTITVDLFSSDTESNG
ncbi:hypothetical protein BJ741DRAFT_619694 [Chytriomyces cf. hyalinus JEL632]|nr:hypothetical protein BJ741DRAFT_619694 [Chytriomyces cf. hyalinus JEL632]